MQHGKRLFEYGKEGLNWRACEWTGQEMLLTRQTAEDDFSGHSRVTAGALARVHNHW